MDAANQKQNATNLSRGAGAKRTRRKAKAQPDLDALANKPRQRCACSSLSATSANSSSFGSLVARGEMRAGELIGGGAQLIRLVAAFGEAACGRPRNLPP